jgi:TRAP-type C4-dicarboxylate transport system permease small subunit
LLGRLAGLIAVVGGVALLGLMGITLTAVVWRYGLNDPLFGIEDLSTMTLTVVVASAIAYGAFHQAHVSVNVIKFFIRRRVTRYTDVLFRALGVGMLLVAALALVKKGRCGFDCGAITNNLSIVHTPFYYVLAAAMAFYAALLMLQLAVGLVHWSGEDPNEIAD